MAVIISRDHRATLLHQPGASLPALLQHCAEMRRALPGADLPGLHTDGLQLAHLAMPAGSLFRARLRRTEIAAADLSGVDATELDAEDVVFRDCDLARLQLQRSRLVRVRFIRCRMAGAQLDDAFLESCAFIETALGAASLQDAEGHRCRFERCLAEELVLCGADLPDSLWWRSDLAGAFAERASFPRAIFRQTNCNRGYYRAADFAAAQLIRVTGVWSDYKGARFPRARIRAFDARFADLRGVTGLTADVAALCAAGGLIAPGPGGQDAGAVVA